MPSTSNLAEDEIARGERYGFGENWKRYLETLDAAKIERSEQSLRGMLGRARLDGLTWLDIGSGSGLFSLAARRLGARVVSFDFDPSSVWCTTELRRRYFPDDADWTVLRGSVLDADFMATLPEADIVYSWGVLHHTGKMYDAIRNAAGKVKPGGLFFIALYHKTILCEAWKVEKRFFSGASEGTRSVLRAAWIAKTRVAFRLKGKSFNAMVKSYGEYRSRGMDYYRDVDDWLGGYPYESITPPECRNFVGELGFTLVRENAPAQGVTIATSSGIDEWVFRRNT